MTYHTIAQLRVEVYAKSGRRLSKPDSDECIMIDRTRFVKRNWFQLSNHNRSGTCQEDCMFVIRSWFQWIPHIGHGNTEQNSESTVFKQIWNTLQLLVTGSAVYILWSRYLVSWKYTSCRNQPWNFLTTQTILSRLCSFFNQGTFGITTQSNSQRWHLLAPIYFLFAMLNLWTWASPEYWTAATAAKLLSDQFVQHNPW